MTDHIQSFFEDLTKEKRSIEAISSERYRRILLLALFEVLARCACPEKENRNQARFVSLIDGYSKWIDKDRISLVQLNYILHAQCVGSAVSGLSEYVNEKLSCLTCGGVYRSFDIDPFVLEIAGIVGDDMRAKELVERARYPVLMWRMRNSLVHELRMPGYAIEMSNDESTPYYHTHVAISGSGPAPHTWELCIPYTLMSSLADSCMEELLHKFRAESRDPYELFRPSANWRL